MWFSGYVLSRSRNWQEKEGSRKASIFHHSLTQDFSNQDSIASRSKISNVTADVTAPQAAIGTRSNTPRIRSGVSHPFQAGNFQQSTSHATTIVIRLAKNVEMTDDRLDRFSRKNRMIEQPLHKRQNNPIARHRTRVSKTLLLTVCVNAAARTMVMSK